MTRAEMRRAAQQANRRGGRRTATAAGAAGGGPKGPVGPPPKKRFIDYPRWGKSGFRRWMPSWKQVLGGGVISLAGLTGLVGVAYATTKVPDWKPTDLAQSNVYQWADGSQMASVGQMNRQNVTLDQVPMPVRQDFMAAENANFYQDNGIDFQGIARAVLHMAEGGEVQSGSTITQQFVKNSIIQNQSQSFSRKFDEILTSIKISQPGNMSKDQIFAGYLNTNYYGRGAYGIQAAARAYFNKDVGQLTLAQGAFLASTVNEPSLFQNIDSDPAAKNHAISRWGYVLDRMVVAHWMTPQQRATFTPNAFPMPVAWKHNEGLTGQTGYMVDLANQFVLEHSNITQAQLDNGGYTIRTTFDKAKTDALTAAVNKTIQSKLDPSQSVNKNVQFGGASIDPSTGKILAIYGGPGADKGYYIDNANATGIQVGSTFKPIVLASAMQNGAVMQPGAAPSKISPTSRFNGDNGIKIKDQQGNYITNASAGTADSSKTNDGLLHQQNDVPTAYGFISLRQAMEMSVNTPYVQLGEYTGYQNVEQMAEKLGVHKDSMAGPSAGYYIGTSTISPIRMASVYATFDNQGMHYDPTSVVSVKGSDGPVQLQTVQPQQAVSPQIANTVTDVLKDVVQKPQGTGTKAAAIGPYVAGKTGTTDQYHSAWFIGYTKQLATAITMFKEDPKKASLESMQGVGGLPKAFGGNFPATVWVDYMNGINASGSVPFPQAAPPIAPGADEPGAPSTAVPSPTAKPSASASASASPSPTSNPSPTDTPTSGCVLFCGGGNGNGKGGKGGPSSGTSATPTPTPTGGGLFGG